MRRPAVTASHSSARQPAAPVRETASSPSRQFDLSNWTVHDSNPRLAGIDYRLAGIDYRRSLRLPPVMTQNRHTGCIAQSYTDQTYRVLSYAVQSMQYEVLRMRYSGSTDWSALLLVCTDTLSEAYG